LVCDGCERDANAAAGGGAHARREAAEKASARGRSTHPSVEVDAVAPEAWDRIAAEFDDATYDQTACFARQQWGAARISSLLLRRDGTAIAGAQVVIVTPPLLGRGLAYVKFGPFWRRRGEPADPETYRSVLRALVAEYCDRRGHCLTVLPRPNPVHAEAETQILREFAFLVRRPMPDPNRYVVDVSLTPDAAMKSLAQKWRYNLKQAQANALDIRLCEGAADIATFAALHGAMVSRKKHDDSDALDLIPALAAGLPERMRPKTVLVFHEGRAVAGAVVGILGDTAYYVFGASEDQALPLKAGYALHWWIAAWLNREGVRWYDLGGEVLDPGLRQFKKGFVGKSGAVVSAAGEFDRWSNFRGRLAADAIYRVRDLKRGAGSLRRRSSRDA
jgi:hypothetical protein